MSTTYSLMSKVARESCRDPFSSSGANQRPFELQHEGAGRHQGDHVVALIHPGAAARRRPASRRVRDLVDLTLLQLRHAAAGRGRRPRSRPRCLASTARAASPMPGFVVVDETGRVEDRLAAEAGRLAVDRRRGALGALRTKLLPNGTWATRLRGGRPRPWIRGPAGSSRCRYRWPSWRSPDMDPGQAAVAVGLGSVAWRIAKPSSRPCGRLAWPGQRSMRWGKSRSNSCGGT